MTEWDIRVLETAEELAAAEDLQRMVWPGSEADIVPVHLLLTAAHNGGLAAGAFVDDRLVGFVFGFPGLDTTASPRRLKHCSHMLGVHPDFRSSGMGYALKCFQWQHVRQQGIERVTWTYDPLLARNAQLNIAKLGAVCNTYLRNLYGDMRDGLNAGLPSDRFQVDWWVNSERVTARMTGRPRSRLGLVDHLAADAAKINPSFADEPANPPSVRPADWPEGPALALQIPADFQELRARDSTLALKWRLSTRAVFEELFDRGYLVSDFVYEAGPPPRAHYVLQPAGL
jgi:predicted GNAT superfamily acetyltransferase